MLGKGKVVLEKILGNALFYEAQTEEDFSWKIWAKKKHSPATVSSPGNVIICCWSPESYMQIFRAVRKHSLTFLSHRWTYTGMISSWYTTTFLPGPHPCACSHLWVEGSSWLKVQRNSTWLFRTGSCNIHLQECNCFWAGTGPGRLIPAGRNSCSCEGSQIWPCCTEGGEGEKWSLPATSWTQRCAGDSPTQVPPPPHSTPWPMGKPAEELARDCSQPQPRISGTQKSIDFCLDCS